jgi:hypothetical protein
VKWRITLNPLAQRLVGAASLIEELTALHRVSYLQRLAKERLFARDTHLSIHLICDLRQITRAKN